MKKFLSVMLLVSVLSLSTISMANATEGRPGKVCGRSVGAAALSFLIWPGIGQLINENPYDKNITHALLGLTVVFRFWSGYDAFVDRKGGVWHNRI